MKPPPIGHPTPILISHGPLAPQIWLLEPDLSPFNNKPFLLLPFACAIASTWMAPSLDLCKITVLGRSQTPHHPLP
jgi:hypothetical protein